MLANHKHRPLVVWPLAAIDRTGRAPYTAGDQATAAFGWDLPVFKPVEPPECQRRFGRGHRKTIRARRHRRRNSSSGIDLLSQPVDLVTFNLGFLGSSPSALTTFSFDRNIFP